MKSGLARGLYSTASYLLTPIALIRLGVKSRSNSGYRHHLKERFGYVASPQRRAKHIHFHAVSVGEVLAAAPMVKLLLDNHEDLSISVSVTTPTGREQANKHLSDLAQISFLPFDNSGAVNRFLQRIQPDLLVMVETEIWPNLIYQCRLNNIPTLLMNGRMSEKSAQNYQRMSSLTKVTMSRINLVLAQFEDDAQRFIKLGCAADSVKTLGNLKFDAFLSDQLRQSAKELRDGWKIASRPVWIAASTHPGEEQSILEVHSQLIQKTPELLLILVPRHPERRPEIESLVSTQGLSLVVRSDLDKESVVNEDISVLLVDTLGELNLFYGLSDLAFVGGSLVPHGGHNPIEPALWDLPVLTGMHCHNFMEITKQLVAVGSLRQCQDSESLRLAFSDLFANAKAREDLGSLSRQVIANNQGSLERQKAQIERLLCEPKEIAL